MNKEMPRETIAEQQIISGMMQSNMYLWNALSTLNADYFYNSTFQKCFSIMAHNKSGDFPMVERACHGTGFDPMDLYDTSHSVTGKTEFALVVTAYKKRRGVEICHAAVNGLLSPDNNHPSQTISEAITALSQSNIEQCRSVKVIGELLPEELDRCEGVVEGKDSAFIKTGISDIDNKLCIEIEDYIPIGGRPSNCKSVLASQICRNLAKESKVSLYFCLDSARSAEVSRTVFAESGVSLQEFNRGVSTKKSFDKLRRGFDIVDKMPIYLDNTKKITTDMIFAQSQRVKSIAGRLDLVVIDFMQNIKSSVRDIRERVSAISEELHYMPSELHCPVIPLSQLSRYQNEETQAPTLKNLKESGDIEEDADKVMLVWYPQKYPCNKDKEDYKNLLQLFVEKNKNGSTGYIPLTVIAPIYSIYNRTKYDDPLKCFRGGE